MTRRGNADRLRSTLVVLLVGSLLPGLVIGGLVPPAGSATGAEAATANETDTAQTSGIRDVTYSGLGVIRDDGNTAYLLDGERHQLNVTVVPEEETDHISICLRVPSTDGARETATANNRTKGSKTMS